MPVTPRNTCNTPVTQMETKLNKEDQAYAIKHGLTDEDMIAFKEEMEIEEALSMSAIIDEVNSYQNLTPEVD